MSTAMTHDKFIHTVDMTDNIPSPPSPPLVVHDRNQATNSRFLHGLVTFLQAFLFSPIPKKTVAEMIGSFLLMFFLCGVSMGDYMTNGKMDIIGHASAAAFSIMIIIFSLGHISGAHVNPSVTIAFAASGKFPWAQVPWYVVGQLLGAILGTLAARALYDVHVDLALTFPVVGEFRAFLMEYIVGAIFMFLASAVSSDARVTGLHASIAVAVTVALAIVVSGPISGASMNPVRSLAPAIVAGKYSYIWIYIFATPFGTISGAMLYKFLTKEYHRAQSANP